MTPKWTIHLLCVIVFQNSLLQRLTGKINAIALQQIAPTTLVRNAKLGTINATTATRTIRNIRMSVFQNLSSKKAFCSMMSKTARIWIGQLGKVDRKNPDNIAIINGFTGYIFIVKSVAVCSLKTKYANKETIQTITQSTITVSTMIKG